MFGNTKLIYSIIFEICLICLLVYVPGLNKSLKLAYVKPWLAATGAWMAIVIVIWEEIRKYFLRSSPDGCVARYTSFWKKKKSNILNYLEIHIIIWFNIFIKNL